jgi:hypothetical protein
LFFKKKSIYDALKSETDPVRKKLLEEYNNKLIFLGEFMVITGMVPEMKEKNEYLNRIKLLSSDFHNINKNNPEEFIKNINIIYKDWKNHILNLDTPEYLEKIKELVLKHLELEKEYIIKDFMKSDSSELNLLDIKDDNVIAAANIELKKVVLFINNEAKRIGVEPHFKIY